MEKFHQIYKSEQKETRFSSSRESEKIVRTQIPLLSGRQVNSVHHLTKHLSIQKIVRTQIPLLNGRQVNGLHHLNTPQHRRRMETEAKAKVVASVWGQILLNSLPP